MSKKKIKVALGLSGGVDSALAAALLIEQGYEVTGVFMECWNEPGCRTDGDRQDALKVALKLKLPFKALDYRKEYKQKVVEWFYKEFKKGRTPNPDVMCNREIKFGLFMDWAVSQGFDLVATGHYAIAKEGRLYRAKDEKKDQTYFLAMVAKEKLKKVLFPIGHLTKAEVRQEAKKRNLPVWDKKDSTGICFIGNDYSFADFLKREIAEHEGEVVNKKGEVIGTHKGVEFYTIGQRHGFEIEEKSTTRPRYFVIDKQMKTNQLVVGGREDLARMEFEVEEWTGAVSGEGFKVRIRHQGRLIKAKIKGKKVILEKAEYGIAPGQVCVVYKDRECVAAGVIVK